MRAVSVLNEHASASRPESARRISGRHAGRAGHREGRAAARDRPGGDPSHQRSRRKGRRSDRRTPTASGPHCTSAFVAEALDRGAELFDWETRKSRSGQRQGSTVRGAGVAVSSFVAGSTGFDGLFVIEPDGKMHVKSGVGNLGTGSFAGRPPRWQPK